MNNVILRADVAFLACSTPQIHKEIVGNTQRPMKKEGVGAASLEEKKKSK